MAESRYLSLEDFEKTDEKSQEKVMKELNSDNESKQYLYWMKYAMDENDRYRAKMTPLAFRGENELSEETQKNLESKKKDLESEIDAIEHAMESYAEEKGIDLDDALNDKDDDKEFESIYDFDEDDDEEDNLEEEQKEAKAIKQSSDFCKLMNEKLSKLTKKLNAIEKQLENKQNNGGDKEFSDSMNNFNMTAKDEDITCSEGLDAVENNLKTAIELLYDSTAKRQIKLLIKPAAIQKLLTTFQNLRKTQLDNVLKTIPSDLPTERKKALVTIYKNDFWGAYEQEVRDFLSKETNMLKLTGRVKVKLKNKGTEIKEKFVNKKDEIVTKVKSKLDFKLKSEEKYDNVLDTMDFEKEGSKDYSIPQGKGDSVQQKIIDLVASTLRPKDAKNDGRSEENTYGGYYSEVQKIMDKYMKDDDYGYGSKNGKDLKVGELRYKKVGEDGNPLEDFDSNTCRFMYTLYAVLLERSGKNNNDSRAIFQRRDKNFPVLYEKGLHEHTEFKTLGSTLTGVLSEAHETLSKSCDNLKDHGELSKNDVKKLLEKFTGITSTSELGKIFHFLCSGDEIDTLSDNYRRYFDKLKPSNQNQNKDKPEEGKK